MRPLPRPVSRTIPLSPEERLRRARARAGPHLDHADAACRAALRGLDEDFADVKRRLPRLADQVLGWESKWLLVSDRLHLGRGGHAALLRRAFGEARLTPENLEARVRQTAEAYLEAARAIEDAALVALRADVADGATTLPIAALDDRAIRAGLEQAVIEAAGRVGVDLRADVARELAALAVGGALARITARLATSVGLLGAGAASSVATFGGGLDVGLVVDRALARAFDGRAGLVRELGGRVDGLRRAVVEGTAEVPGLRARLERLDRERVARRRAAVLAGIGAEGRGP